MNAKTMGRWVAAVVAMAAFFLPALRVAAPPVISAGQWTGWELVRTGWESLGGHAPVGESYVGAVSQLGFEQLIFHPEAKFGVGPPAGAPPIAMLRMSGIFRLARFIPVELLAMAACGLGVLTALAFSSQEWARALAGLGTVCGIFAVLLFWWLDDAGRGQWDILGSQLPAQMLPPWRGVTPLVGLYLTTASWLGFLFLPRAQRGA